MSRRHSSSASNVFRLPQSVLGDGDVDVVVTELASWTSVVEDPTSGLSDDEFHRAGSHPAGYGTRFLQGRAFLRHVLARYVGCAPGELSFRNGPEGKPLLADSPQDVRFNLSHSGGLAVCGVRKGFDIGVDVEVVRKVRSLERIAERVFPADSAAAVARAADPRRLVAFLRAWTRREAVIKLLGAGLMTLSPDPWSAGAAWDGVSTYDLDLGPSWVGAVAVRAPSKPPNVREWMFPSAATM